MTRIFTRASVALICLIGSTTTCFAEGLQNDEFLVRSAPFEGCELEGFIALSLGRQAIFFKESKEELLKTNAVGEFQVNAINELYSEMSNGKLAHYAPFAARKFYQCTDENNLKVEKNIENASVCFARLDLQFFAYVSRINRDAKQLAINKLKRNFAAKSSETYPPKLIDKIVEMEYSRDGEDFDIEARRFIFETCLFPKDWKLWYESTRAAQK